MPNFINKLLPIAYLILLILFQIIANRLCFYPLFICYSLLFVIYGAIIYGKKSGHIWFWGILFRGLFLFSIPFLSDDFYRFLWDGRLLVMGLDVYQYLPKDIIVQFSGDYMHTLFRNMNSPQYYSVYPPFNQILFSISGLYAGDKLVYGVLIMRILILVFEMGIFVLITQLTAFLKKDSKKILALYAFNPLIIIELSGNLHFEGLVLFCLLLSWFIWLRYGQIILSAVIFGLAVSTKMIPLILLPFVFNKLKYKNGFLFSIVVLAVNLILIAYFMNLEDFSNMNESIRLFRSKFEYNAGLWYILRYFGELFTGFNILKYAGPILSLFTLIGILFLSFKSRFSFAKTCLYIYLVYLGFSTTVHPWYLIVPLGISLFTETRMMIFWSFWVFLSYYAYRFSPVQENLFVIAVEYISIAIFMVFEKQIRAIGNDFIDKYSSV